MRLFSIFLLLRALRYASVAWGYLPPSSAQPIMESIYGFLIFLIDPILFFGFLSIVFPVKLIMKRCWVLLLPAIILGAAYAIIYIFYPQSTLLQQAFQLFELALSALYVLIYVKIILIDFPTYMRSNYPENKQMNVRGFLYIGIILVVITLIYLTTLFIHEEAITLIVISETAFGFIAYAFLYNYYRVNYKVKTNLIEANFTSFMLNDRRSPVLKILFPGKLILKRIEEALTKLNQNDRMDYLHHRLTHYFTEKKPYLQNDLSLDNIARSLNTNRTYISQILKRENTSFYDFVNSYRIEEAKQMIQRHPFRLKNIAEECGFSSYTTFIKYFEKKERTSPKAWRDKNVLQMSDP